MPLKLPIFRYALLTLLFATTVAYEVPYLRDTLRDQKRSVPLFIMQSASDRVAFVSPEARRAGLQKNDELLAINGRPYNGLGDWGQAIDLTPAGTDISLRVRSSGNGSERTVVLAVSASKPKVSDVFGDTIIYFVLPLVSVLLGFWVAFQRPHDPMAWLLLTLMLTFPHIFESYKIQAWPPGWREAAMIYHLLLGQMFAVIMFLFGRYFPEPFPRNSARDWIWRIMQWSLALIFTVFVILAVIQSTLELRSYRAAAPFGHLSQRVEPAMQLIVYVLVGSFFAAVGTKYGRSKSKDVKRRLRILYWGSSVAFTPTLLITVYGRLHGKSIAEIFPQWVILTAVVPLLIFPLTLAYVIVVEKAMDVSLVVRQGLQYALARNGTRAVQMILFVIVILTAMNMASDVTHNRLQKVVVIALGVVAVFTIRRAGDHLRAWIDRRFFREAYDTEQVLTDLSDEVRSMVEPKSLVETVSSRISETLHVQRVAVLLGSDTYQPAYAMGYSDLPKVAFPCNAGTVQILHREKEPTRVYLENRDSWVYREADVDEPERQRLTLLGTELLLPLAVRDKLLGFISLGPKRSEEPYTGSDVRLLKSVAAQTGLALENADLMRKISDEVAQRERLSREVEIAREVQERLFPQKLPPIIGLDYAGNCRPALGVGGDYYDFLALPQGHLGVAIGDVSGKGIAAALMMASLQASLRGEATRAPENLAAAVSNINRLVYEASSANRYATLFYGQYDPETRSFDYVNAGHNPPMLFHSAKGKLCVTRLEIGGTVVGLLEGSLYGQGRVTLAAGDLLLAFTDGISEAMNKADEEWGEERLTTSIEGCDGMDARQVLERVFQEADTFVAGAKQHDDMTLVVLRALK